MRPTHHTIRLRWLLIPAAVGLALCVVPLVAMATQLDYASVWSDLSAPSSQAALWLSLRTALLATALSALFGVPLAVLIARLRGRAATLLRASVLIPMVLPPVVAGIALLSTFGRAGLLGPVVRDAQLQIVFSTTAVVLAQTFVAMPFLVLSLEGALRQYDSRFESIAATLGGRPLFVVRTVWLPLLAPSLRAGLILTFARALGEFGATMTFAGSLEGVTRTLPLEIYLQREDDPQRALALSVLLVLVAIVTIVLTGTRQYARTGRST